MAPWQGTCPVDGIFTISDKQFGKSIKEGGVQEQPGHEEFLGEKIFLGNCPRCRSTLSVIEVKSEGTERKG